MAGSSLCVLCQGLLTHVDSFIYLFIYFQVSLELLTDGNNASSEKPKLVPRDTSPSQLSPRPQRENASRTHYADDDRKELQVGSLEESRLKVWSPQKPLKEPFSHPDHTSTHKSWQQVEEDPKVLLHTLLMVPDGRNFSCGPTKAPNVYLNCKLFWCDEMARSVVSWGQANPSFNFVQVSPQKSSILTMSLGVVILLFIILTIYLTFSSLLSGDSRCFNNQAVGEDEK